MLPVVDVEAVFVHIILWSGIAGLFLQAFRDPRWYWIGTLVVYVLSFLGSWSIGLYMLSIAVVMLSLGVGHAAGWVRKTWHSLLATAVGIGVWYLAVNMIDDYWLFWPLHVLF